MCGARSKFSIIFCLIKIIEKISIDQDGKVRDCVHLTKELWIDHHIIQDYLIKQTMDNSLSHLDKYQVNFVFLSKALHILSIFMWMFTNLIKKKSSNLNVFCVWIAMIASATIRFVCPLPPESLSHTDSESYDSRVRHKIVSVLMVI